MIFRRNRRIRSTFRGVTPYIAWENKSCGHSPGGRLDTGRCHRTRVAATATDRVREREDGYQWLHYTIPVNWCTRNMVCVRVRVRAQYAARVRDDARVCKRRRANRVHRTNRTNHRTKQTKGAKQVLSGIPAKRICLVRRSRVRRTVPYTWEYSERANENVETTKRDERCMPVLHPVSRVYFSTSILPIRYRLFCKHTALHCGIILKVGFPIDVKRTYIRIYIYRHFHLDTVSRTEMTNRYKMFV